MNNHTKLSNEQSTVQSKLIRQLYLANNLSATVSMLLGGVLAYIQRDVISHTIIAAWLALLVFFSLARVFLASTYFKAADAQETLDHAWLTKFRYLAIAAGVVWASAGFLLFPENQLQHQTFLIFMLAGLTTGAIISYKADLVTAVTFAILVITPIVIKLFIVGDNMSIAMSFAALLYLGFMLVSVFHIYRNTYKNIALQAEAAKREETLRASEEKYRLLLNHSPIGIFHYDTNHLVTFCNDFYTKYMHSSKENIIGSTIKTTNNELILHTFNKALLGEVSQYEGHYSITNSDVEGWISLTCAPSLDANKQVVGGIAILQDMSEKKQAEHTIENLASYDKLTQLPNRQLLLERLNHDVRTSQSGALLFIGLDHFKILNDSLGHDVGDLLLRQVAARLTRCLRENDFIARVGGDEFVILLDHLSNKSTTTSHATAIAEEILSSLKKPYQLNRHEYQSTASIGIATFTDYAQPLEDILRHADIAMYQAKQSGRDTLCLFDETMQVAVNSRVALEADLRKAIEQQQFQLYYQTQVDSEQKVLGAEALIQWHHPDRGLISPAEFIPLAEESSLILPIGQWVLETACAQLKVWQQNTSTHHLTMSVNVSARQFHQADFAAQLKEILERHAVNPAQLKLELTESILLEDIDDTIATMNALNRIGIQFSLDDFGTGYSSLQYLKKLPLTQLKIDQSFVQDITINSSDKAIIRTIIAMAKSLDLDVIAEGVETEEQLQLLLNKGCQRFQGYLFGQPAPISQLNI